MIILFSIVINIMKNMRKGEDGKYHAHGHKYDLLEGSRAQVFHGTAYRTSGGLTKKDLMKNKRGEIVSKKKHETAKKEKRLEKAGYYTRKGHFGFVKHNEGKKHNKTHKKSRKSRH